MAPLVLYSTNVFLKQYIQQIYRRDIHYVWCSEIFDSATAGRYAPAALIPPSSNPADIYRELERDVRKADTHSAKITAQRASFIRRAEEWHRAGELTLIEHDDIIYMVTNGPFDQVAAFFKTNE